MSDIVIKFENISKQYRLGTIGTGTLSHDLKRWWIVNVQGREDPYIKIGPVNTVDVKVDSDYVWALRNISLEIKQGEVLGIIGKNGAGKSTLLKILSRVTTPTTGRITAFGRIASLLEVGTGFHPEMTGRENIYMNGSIMGMTKTEITRKMEAIVDFAGVEKYIDTPVKRYSSGMTVRLGFAVAAHLEPEILVVDEVLAVGDYEFQRKAIGKMNEISHNTGKTILFVSHNMGAIRSLCQRGIILRDGQIVFSGEINEAVDLYIEETKSHLTRKVAITDNNRLGYCSKDVEFISIELLNSTEIATDEAIRIKISLRVNNNKRRTARLMGMLNGASKNRVGLFFTEEFKTPVDNNKIELEVVLRNHNLAKGQYMFDFNVGTGDPTTGVTDFDIVYNTVSFEVVYDSYLTKSRIVKWLPNWGFNNFKHIELKSII